MGNATSAVLVRHVIIKMWLIRFVSSGKSSGFKNYRSRKSKKCLNKNCSVALKRKRLSLNCNQRTVDVNEEESSSEVKTRSGALY